MGRKVCFYTLALILLSLSSAFAGQRVVGDLSVSGNTGLGNSSPSYKLHVSGTAAAQTLRFGTNLDNILPSTTGANNQILKTNATGVITWQADNDTGGGSGATTAAKYVLQVADSGLPNGFDLSALASGFLKVTTGTGNLISDTATYQPSGTYVASVTGSTNINVTAGTNPTISLTDTIPTANLGILPTTKLSGTVPDANIGILTTSKLSGTVPDVNIGILNTTKLSGTIPDANIGILAASKLTGTVPYVSMSTIPLNGSLLIGTLPATQVAVIPLATGVSGTLPYTSMSTIPLSGNLLIGTLPLSKMDTIPLDGVWVQGTLPAAKMTVVDLTSTMISGTLPAANLPIVPLGVRTSGTLANGATPRIQAADSITASALQFGTPQANFLPLTTGAAGQVLTPTVGNLKNLAWANTSAGGGSSLASFTNTNPGYVLAMQGTNTATGASLMIWDNSNMTLNLGIGTTSNSNARLYIRGSTSQTGFLLRIANTASTDRIVVLDNGNVGIGTTAPVGLFHIVGSGTGVGIGNTQPFGLLVVGTSPSRPIFFVDNTNVGIGTTTPGALLQINQILITGTTKTGFALCLTATGALGRSSTIVGADGSCTCNAM